MKKTLFILALLTSFTSLFSQTYSSTTIVTGLNYPVAFAVAPDGRFFITQKGGNSAGSCALGMIKVYSAAGVSLGTFYDLTDSVQCDFERGLLGIELDPNFATNHYVYAYYNHLYAGDERIRIARFTEVANVGTNPTIIFDLNVSESINGNHVGGNLHFRPSDPNHIYFTIGDIAYQLANASLNYANKLTNPYGKIHRINADGTVPTDNPFYDDGNPLVGNCDWIWSYGHRNSFDFCFNPVTDSMYCTENGQNSWDEANIIHRGAFYGWANCEGDYMNASTTVPCNLTGDVRPITTWGPGSLPAVTGIVYYSGSVWPALDNHLIIADNDFGRIYDCTMGNAPVYDVVTTRVQMGDLTTTGGLTTLRQSSDGCIFAMKGGYTTNGQIYKVCPLGIGLNSTSSMLTPITAYPNPAKTNLTLDFSLAQDVFVTAEIVDVTGRLVASEIINATQGKNSIRFDLKKNTIESGIYFIQLKNKNINQIIATTKIIIE